MYRCYLSTIWLYLASVFVPFACSPVELYPLTGKEIRPIKALINKNQHCSDWTCCWQSYRIFFFQNMYENFYQGKIFQDMNYFFRRSGVQCFPTIFPALHLTASVDLGQVPSAQVLYPDVEHLQLLDCTFVSELCLSICHSTLIISFTGYSLIASSRRAPILFFKTFTYTSGT